MGGTEAQKLIDNVELIPVLQLDDLAVLKAAQEHLGKDGYVTKVTPFSDLAPHPVLCSDSGALLCRGVFRRPGRPNQGGAIRRTRVREARLSGGAPGR
jgi:hypothetical protein